MRSILQTLALVPLALAPLFGGGMILEIGNAKANPAALAKQGVILARLTACQSPAKGVWAATVEGLVAGKRQTLPLKVDNLAEPGVWSISRAWPNEGKWVVPLVASHPESGDHTSSVVVGVTSDLFDWARVQRFNGKPPSADDLAGIPAK